MQVRCGNLIYSTYLSRASLSREDCLQLSSNTTCSSWHPDSSYAIRRFRSWWQLEHAVAQGILGTSWLHMSNPERHVQRCTRMNENLDRQFESITKLSTPVPLDVAETMKASKRWGKHPEWRLCARWVCVRGMLVPLQRYRADTERGRKPKQMQPHWLEPGSRLYVSTGSVVFSRPQSTA